MRVQSGYGGDMGRQIVLPERQIKMSVLVSSEKCIKIIQDNIFDRRNRHFKSARLENSSSGFVEKSR